MRRIMTGIALSSLLVSAAGWADENYSTNDPSASGASDQSYTYSETHTTQESASSPDLQKQQQDMQQKADSTQMKQQAGTAAAGTAATADETGGVTEAKSEEVSRGELKNGKFALQPMAGVLLYPDALGNDSARAAGGLGLDWNMSKTFFPGTRTYLGLNTGAIYSHLGTAGSNFFGSNSPATVTNDAGANMLIIPGNLKIGYNVLDNLRISARGGINLTYRSVANAAYFGGSSSTGNGSSWKVFPDVGGDIEIGVAPNVAVLLRPDYTFTPGNDFFTGMVGIGLNLG